jgi:GT2 family glycosyltransferase/glycosyltransferase involved in cell wall biosynthesis
LNETVKVAFVSGPKELMPALIARMQDLAPGLPLYVVSEFRPPAGRWIPYHPNWSMAENLALCHARLAGKQVKFSAVILEPRMPYWRMRWIGFRISPRGFLLFNENLDHFMPRPRCAGAILGHVRWRVKSFLVRQLRPGGATYTFLWRLFHPYAFERPLLVVAARAMGSVAALLKRVLPVRSRPAAPQSRETGISVIVPSRDGKHLLEGVLDDARRELHGYPGEIIVVDNGSMEGTREWLRARHPDVVVEWHAGPLSFAAAVNRGIARARYSHICLLNNDMRLEAEFFAPLLAAFEQVPDLFSATAQILFPEGQRRQETGKAVKPRRPGYKGTDFPLWCDVPIAGENLSYVLYGSGGCSLYDADKLRRLGGFDAGYAPAYVEDLDVGFRAWRCGWPTVFVEGARVVHQHRATTSRFYSEQALEKILERNYLRFLSRSVASPAVFRELWREARARLNRMAASEPPSRVAMSALRKAWLAPFWVGRPDGAALDEAQIFALGSGDVAVFAGRQPTGAPRVVIASPYLPFPLSHGGAVRIYNLMRCAASSCDQVLVAFVDNLRTPPQELLDIAVEVVLVRLVGSHMKPSSERPDEVEEFDSLAFRAALAQTVRKWKPGVVQLEYTQMAQYAEAAAPAKTILVEHDVTFDLYRQMLAQGEDWEIRRKFERWHRFETAAWKRVDAVAVMSQKDRLMVEGARAECLANGVDLDRFQPCAEPPDAARLLFIGSFAHLPNILAVEFFLRDVWPKLAGRGITLHIIAGARHQFYLDFHRDRVTIDLARPGIEVEDFVADPRPAYRRATLVVAPLVASAGTNIKVMEAMAMGRVVVSTPAGVNGLDLEPGLDVVVEETGEGLADAIIALLDAPGRRREMERAARSRVERDYDWRVVARRQVALYETLRAKAT